MVDVVITECRFSEPASVPGISTAA